MKMSAKHFKWTLLKGEYTKNLLNLKYKIEFLCLLLYFSFNK